MPSGVDLRSIGVHRSLLLVHLSVPREALPLPSGARCVRPALNNRQFLFRNPDDRWMTPEGCSAAEVCSSSWEKSLLQGLACAWPQPKVNVGFPPVLEQYSWCQELRAVKNGNVVFADGNLFFNRSGMTVSQTAEIIAEILHVMSCGKKRTHPLAQERAACSAKLIRIGASRSWPICSCRP